MKVLIPFTKADFRVTSLKTDILHRHHESQNFYLMPWQN